MEHVYAIFDRKAESYGSPFTAVTDGCALRVFDLLLSQDTQKIAKYPEDFDLVFIGSFDPLSGRLDSCVSRTVTTAIERITYYRALQEMREKITTPCPDESEVSDEDI